MSATREVRVRRRPKVSAFLLVGLVAGVLLAAVLAYGIPTSTQYSPGQVFGFLAVLGAPLGAAVGGLVAVVIDARSSRRARIATAELERPAARAADGSGLGDPVALAAEAAPKPGEAAEGEPSEGATQGGRDEEQPEL